MLSASLDYYASVHSRFSSNEPIAAGCRFWDLACWFDSCTPSRLGQSTMKAFTIGIIEDENLVMRLLASLCEEETDGTVIFLAPNAQSAWAKLAVILPDLLLVDINLPDDDGIALALTIRAKHPSVKIIMLTAESKEYTVNRIRQSGLNGYVDKSEDPGAIITAIHDVVVKGGFYFSPLGKQVARITAADQNSFTKILSDRELEILPLFGMGMSADDIAAQMKTEPTTILRHRANIMSKLQIQNASELVHFCLQKGFIRGRPDGAARPTTQPPFQ